MTCDPLVNRRQSHDDNEDDEAQSAANDRRVGLVLLARRYRDIFNHR